MVMMWQPIASAWTMFRSSRGLAQISSAVGAALMIVERLGHDAAPGRRPCRRSGPANTETYARRAVRQRAA